jgi:dihydroneopterin aldolase
MDKIIIRDLQASVLIGTLEHERTRRQQLRAALELELDLHPAGAADDLALSVDYSEIARRALEIMSTSRFQLLEALGYALGRMLLEYLPVHHASVRLEKPRAIPGAQAEIVMEFDRAAQEGRRDG